MKLFKSIRLVSFVLLALAVLFGCSSNKSADQAKTAYFLNRFSDVIQFVQVLQPQTLMAF